LDSDSRISYRCTMLALTGDHMLDLKMAKEEQGTYPDHANTESVSCVLSIEDETHDALELGGQFWHVSHGEGFQVGVGWGTWSVERLSERSS